MGHFFARCCLSTRGLSKAPDRRADAALLQVDRAGADPLETKPLLDTAWGTVKASQPGEIAGYGLQRSVGYNPLASRKSSRHFKVHDSASVRTAWAWPGPCTPAMRDASRCARLKSIFSPLIFDASTPTKRLELSFDNSPSDRLAGSKDNRAAAPSRRLASC